VAARAVGKAIPGADRQAIVAAIDAIADRLAKLVRDRPFVLYGKIGDAAPGIELEGRGEGIGRADRLAGIAAAAVLGMRRIRLQLQRREDGAEEQPAAVLAADEIGMLALPADPRRFGERLFHHRRSVDEHL